MHTKKLHVIERQYAYRRQRHVNSERATIEEVIARCLWLGGAFAANGVCPGLDLWREKCLRKSMACQVNIPCLAMCAQAQTGREREGGRERERERERVSEGGRESKSESESERERARASLHPRTRIPSQIHLRKAVASRFEAEPFAAGWFAIATVCLACFVGGVGTGFEVDEKIDCAVFDDCARNEVRDIFERATKSGDRIQAHR